MIMRIMVCDNAYRGTVRRITNMINTQFTDDCISGSDGCTIHTMIIQWNILTIPYWVKMAGRKDDDRVRVATALYWS
jgi:hypothetical protein